ncbi:MAG: DUF1259 domain-containing protein [Gemmatimonadaceae bacterium]
MQDSTHGFRSLVGDAMHPSPGHRHIPGAAALALAVTVVALAACSTEGSSGQGQSKSSAEEHAAQQAQQPSAAGTAAADPTDSIDWKAVAQAMGRSGAMQPGDVYKFSMPRSDLHVTVHGVSIKPALSLGSWLAMKPKGDSGVVAMGDLVLTQDEVGPVMARLQEGGIMETALHNHLLHESPRVMYMHIHGEGDPIRIAHGVRAALALTKTPAAASGSSPSAASSELDTAQIRQALGHGGKVNGGVYQVSVPRPETIRMSGIEVPPAMGTATSINFEATGGGRAAINGDFVMTAGEVNPVIRALTESGIDVVAVHNHMLTEQPRLFFLHYWANDDAVKLARGLRRALDLVQGQPGAPR